MSSRQVFGAGAVLLVAASALYYLVLAPARGPAVAPGATQVALTATATGSGSWVRYLLTVKNVADGTFSGDVLLIDLDQPSQAGVTSSLPSSLSAATRVPVPQEVAGQSAYQVHVTVPSRRSRTVSVLAPDRFNYAQATSGGLVLADAPVERSPVVPVAVLSDLETAADAIGRLRLDRFSPRVAQFTNARDLPHTPLLLAGYAALVVDRFDTAALSTSQVAALRDFVGLGGALVIAGGADWRRTVAPLPGDLLALHPSSTAVLPLSPLARLAGVSLGDLSAPAAVGSLGEGARALVTGSGGEPLLAERLYGTGRVVQLAFDPAAEPVTGSAYAGLAWLQSLARGFSQAPSGGAGASTMLGAEPGFTALLPPAGDAPLPNPYVLGALLLLYIAIVGPLGYLLVRRRLARPPLFWLSVPLAALLFTGGFYALGQLAQAPVQDHEVQVLKVGPQGAVSSIEYHRILFLRRGNHEIEPPADALVAPLTLDTYRTTGSTCERCTNQLEGLPSGAEHVLPGQRPVVRENGVVYGSVRVVAGATAMRLRAGLDAHLTLRGGHVRGTVENVGGRPVGDLALFTYDGRSYHSATLTGLLAPHAKAGVDAVLAVTDQGSPGATGAGSAAGAPGILQKAVGLTAVGRSGQTVLVGLTVPTGTSLMVDGSRPPGLAVGVIQQAVSLEAADGSLRDFESKRLASSVGDPGRGFVDVYDIGLPGTTTPLVLTSASQLAGQVEVYDWTRDAWRTLPGPAEGDEAPTFSTALAAGETQGGLVRVRVHEPRLQWGATIWVETPPKP